jgi:hypothetical protein
MHRFITVAAILLLLTGPVSQAQQFTFGPKVGFTSSHFTTNQDTLLDSFRQGFQGGVFFRFYGDYLYCQPELMYVIKGGVFDSENQDFKEEIDLQSIDIPVVFGLKLGPDEFNFRIHTGPVASFIIQKTIDVTYKGVTKPFTDDNTKDFMLGQTVGLGLDILSFSIDVRYEFGWDNMYASDVKNSNVKWKHEMFNVSLAYKIL